MLKEVQKIISFETRQEVRKRIAVQTPNLIKKCHNSGIEPGTMSA